MIVYPLPLCGAGEGPGVDLLKHEKKKETEGAGEEATTGRGRKRKEGLRRYRSRHLNVIFMENGTTGEITFELGGRLIKISPSKW